MENKNAGPFLALPFDLKLLFNQQSTFVKSLLESKAVSGCADEAGTVALVFVVGDEERSHGGRPRVDDGAGPADRLYLGQGTYLQYGRR